MTAADSDPRSKGDGGENDGGATARIKKRQHLPCVDPPNTARLNAPPQSVGGGGGVHLSHSIDEAPASAAAAFSEVAGGAILEAQCDSVAAAGDTVDQDSATCHPSGDGGGGRTVAEAAPGKAKAACWQL